MAHGETPRKSNDASTHPIAPVQLLGGIRTLIKIRRNRVAQAVNTELVLMYWQIGDLIRREILQEARAEYGQQIIEVLSQILTCEYGRGFSRRNLSNMMCFAEVLPELEILQTLSAQLAWSHFLEIIYLKDSLQQDFYTENWCVKNCQICAIPTK